MVTSCADLLAVGTLACNFLGQLVAARPPPSGCNATTAIDGNVFPPLIEATIEDLILGYEMSWFTSVDVVQVLLFSLQDSQLADSPRLTFQE